MFREEILEKMNEILAEYGGEANVPLTSEYWALRNQYQTAPNKFKTIPPPAIPVEELPRAHHLERIQPSNNITDNPLVPKEPVKEEIVETVPEFKEDPQPTGVINIPPQNVPQTGQQRLMDLPPEVRAILEKRHASVLHEERELEKSKGDSTDAKHSDSNSENRS